MRNKISPIMDGIRQALVERNAWRRVAHALFATPNASEVSVCRSCGCPTLHMKHLTLEQAYALEKSARELLGQVSDGEESL